MRVAIPFPALLLAACATTPADTVVVEPGESCRREALASFVGLPATQETGARMLRESKARRLRWVAKGTMITMDYSGDRLTVYLDANNRVERANCG